jgi:aminopeptidase N
MKKVVALCMFFGISVAFAQDRVSRELHFDLIHTELHIQPNWQDQTLSGQAKLRLKPYFYPQEVLVLDAKAMQVSAVRLGKKSLNFENTGRELKIRLDKKYTASDTLVIEVDYLAQPELVKPLPGEENKSEKGLYFINPRGEVKGMPTQFWTQGETECNSAWFPTLDAPNQKHTQDIYLTLEKKYTTLSNGILISSKDVGKGLKTDHWSQKIPHAVYLSMIAGGDFVKVTDPNFKRFEVSYYMEPEYAPHAQGIFGRTPEMITFFESILGVKYPWEKYAQVPIRKFISGAMENTTATTHARSVLKNGHQLVDANDDAVIAHELFHHWFGNLVTCESWGHLALNEAFANYSEYLWANHKYGKDEGDFVNLTDLQSYLGEAAEKQEPLIRYQYGNSEELFDAHSYQKGGRILHTLRREVGDQAFFKALNLYLTQHAYQNAEVEDLRIAFEKVSGRDLRWFFDQWFKSAGHPIVQIQHKVEGSNLILTTRQVPDSTGLDVFRVQLPLRLYSGETVKDTVLHLSEEQQEFILPLAGAFKNFIPNSEGYFPGVVQDERGLAMWVHQYEASPAIYARMMALEAAFYLSEEPMANAEVRALLRKGLKDPFWRIRQLAVSRFSDYDGPDFLEIERELEEKMKGDSSSNVRAEAFLSVKNFLNPRHLEIARVALGDTSYGVRAAALEMLLSSEVADGDSLAKAFENTNDGPIFGVVANYYLGRQKKDVGRYIMERIQLMESMELYQYLGLLASYLLTTEESEVEKALPFLREVAIDEPAWYARMSAVRVLFAIKDINTAAAALFEEAITKETDPKLQQYYQQFNVER